MHIDQARTLKAALESAIAKAEANGSDEVTLSDELDATLGQALDEARNALEAGRRAGEAAATAKDPQ